MARFTAICRTIRAALSASGRITAVRLRIAIITAICRPHYAARLGRCIRRHRGTAVSCGLRSGFQYSELPEPWQHIWPLVVTTRANSANDSAGILGNITAYEAAKVRPPWDSSININVVDCLNAPGVKIYSGSMASGIVGFFSVRIMCCRKAITMQRYFHHGISTANIVLNIDRCRNYAYKDDLVGIVTSAPVSSVTADGSAATRNTYIQNCYSVPDLVG